MREQKMTGYPSIDKPWLKYYSDEAINSKVEECSIYQYIYSKNKDYLNGIAIRYFGRKITYKTLFENIESCAKGLSALGVQKGDIVTIQSLSMPQVIILLYALSKLGAVANMVFVSETEKNLRDILVETETKLYITIDAIYPKVVGALENTRVENIILMEVGDEADIISKFVLQCKSKRINAPETNEWKYLEENQVHYTEINDGTLPVVMVYTGGTTGKSKAVVLTNNGINSFVFQYANSGFTFERGKSFMNMLPPFIAFGLTISIHLPLSVGAPIILMLDPTATNAGKNFAKYKPNYFVHGVEAIESILNNKQLQKSDLHYIEILAAGGEAIPLTLENDVKEFLGNHNCNQRLIVGYGMTEVGATVCTTSYNAVKTGTVGIPLPNASVKIFNIDTLQECTYNEDGEICFLTPTVMKEYYHNQKETQNILRLHDDGNVWVHTGDIGHIDEDGFVSVVGRIKRIVELRRNDIYHKVFPRLIEKQMEAIDGIRGVTIVGKGKAATENELVAFVVTDENQQWQKLEQILIDYAKNNLEIWEQPAEYKHIEQFPRTEIGKVDYRKLEEMATLL